MFKSQTSSAALAVNSFGGANEKMAGARQILEIK